MEPRPAAAPAPARASAGASRAATPAASRPPRPGAARTRGGRPLPAERRFGDPRSLRVGRAHSRRRTTFPTRGCVTGRHVRGRRGASPARPRAQAQSAALRPAGRTTPRPRPPPPRPASQLLEGRPGRSCGIGPAQARPGFVRLTAGREEEGLCVGRGSAALQLPHRQGKLRLPGKEVGKCRVANAGAPNCTFLFYTRFPVVPVLRLDRTPAQPVFHRGFPEPFLKTPSSSEVPVVSGHRRSVATGMEPGDPKTKLET